MDAIDFKTMFSDGKTTDFEKIETPLQNGVKYLQNLIKKDPINNDKHGERLLKLMDLAKLEADAPCATHRIGALENQVERLLWQVSELQKEVWSAKYAMSNASPPPLQRPVVH